MAIINFNPNNNQIPKAGQTNSSSTKTGPEHSPSVSTDRHASTDSIDLTDSAKLIHHLEEQLRRLPIVDSNRVSLARENLNSGNYQISSQSIAVKLTRYESLLQKAI